MPQWSTTNGQIVLHFNYLLALTLDYNLWGRMDTRRQNLGNCMDLTELRVWKTNLSQESNSVVEWLLLLASHAHTLFYCWVLDPFLRF